MNLSRVGFQVRAPASLSVGVATAVSLLTSAVVADEFTGIGVLPGGTSTVTSLSSVSADGLTVVGRGDSPETEGGDQAFRWTATGGIVGLGTLPGATRSEATGVSAEGSVVVGSSANNGAVNPVTGYKSEAFRWTEAGGMVGLGVLPGGDASWANAVSGDGLVVVGAGTSSVQPIHNQAFRWTEQDGMVGLGFLPGGIESEARGTNYDGSVVVGRSFVLGAGNRAFRWTADDGMVNLGMLPSDPVTINSHSIANAVSSDGSTVVGESTNGVTPTSVEAFRWTESSGMVGLGLLNGGTYSVAVAVNADGTVVVGQANSTNAPGGEAFRWSTTSGMQSVTATLRSNGVNLSGWNLETATGVSADGSVVVGIGSRSNRPMEVWIARLTGSIGVITPSIVAESFAGLNAMGKATNAAIGGTLGVMNEYATQARQTGSRNGPFSVFGYGAYDSDPVSSGLLGMTVDLPSGIVVGATIGANGVKADMVFGGTSKMAGPAGGAFVARVPEAGLQWLVGVGGTDVSGEVRRGYLSGNTPVYSNAETSGRGAGLVARVGWSFKDPVPNIRITPFASYTVATSSFPGYFETGGPFPAQLSPFTSTAQTARAGIDARYTFAPDAWLWGSATWAHRLDGARNADISGTLVGLFTLTAPGIASAVDWAELTGGIRLPVWRNGSVTASVTTSWVPQQPQTYVSRVGIVQAF